VPSMKPSRRFNNFSLEVLVYTGSESMVV
jgi:hypothetical protein